MLKIDAEIKHYGLLIERLELQLQQQLDELQRWKDRLNRRIILKQQQQELESHAKRA